MQDTTKGHFREVFTGYLRPRHLRFSKSLQKLFDQNNTIVSDVEWQRNRIKTALNCRLHGFRGLKLPDSNSQYLVHQELNISDIPYLAEFDLPLGLHNYNINYHRKSFQRTKELLETDKLACFISIF